MATQQNASFFSIPVFHSSSEFRVNTAYFSKEDLSLFVENLETIENLKRKERQRFEEQIRETRTILENALQIATQPSNVGCMPSPTSSVNEELRSLCIARETPRCNRKLQPESPIERQELQPKRPISMRRSSDEEETYFSDANASPDRTPVSTAKKPRLLFAPSPRALKDNNSGSDSEESGIYPLADTPQQKPFRSRTNALAEKPKISTGSRILALLLRREILKNQQKDQPEEIVRIKKAASNLNVSKEHEEHDFHEFIKQKYKRFALRYIRKMKKHVVVEEEPEKPSDLEMLDKALRYMTL
ncbi:PREDICTED: uncharacterized protein LOC108972605 [Bactrocera latifrons]|uniref:uncharacterized protein LOC108972605 n=1 Tax=Bactrocera latifrons TaxID=174628 RepID=UPI0008DDB327|nr:PREDICTED: uncharacterized protein LOC108972605 [Bactrocera latifrons]